MKYLTLPAAAACLMLLNGYADAQAPAPNTSPLGGRSVALVVPFSAGGGTDTLARLIAERFKALTDSTVVVDNKAGANGLIASQFVARAKPDGLTLMLGSSSTHVIEPLLSADKTAMETVQKKFVLVSVVAKTPLVLAVNGSSKIQTLDQFLGQTDKEVTFGTYGVHSSPHLMGSLLGAERGLRLVHVPYKGSAPAVTDLLSGNIDSVFLTVAAINSFVEAGQARALAVTGTQRVATLPDVPTFKERGVAGFDNAGWFAVFAPAGVPEVTVGYLRNKLHDVMAEPAIQAKLRDLGLQDASDTFGKGTQAWQETIGQTAAILKKTKLDLDHR
ncbi:MULTISPECIES: tripartite tricarboxylate transporter substrate binding protein [Rhodopseudomonas]|uniref:Bug family tripartite tricarboxylate transporter substrate binding protein n=1 Tax=Rhodopseudomonas TaxID=1073 RepID=UPI000696AB57|nr:MULTISPECIES: tripartite tricarboxylate transporter substrate binding protein [Rhodopseudomonas]MDF3811008.1 tripartite tricarboxylate transporter substrate binding protein [Rhodopseudomonas sp. BAL398]WOK15906.1 tripartite tricarboxylate transporter substrate binding protein [Rhodopseudomonas sp. BAL398]